MGVANPEVEAIDANVQRRGDSQAVAEACERRADVYPDFERICSALAGQLKCQLPCDGVAVCVLEGERVLTVFGDGAVGDALPTEASLARVGSLAGECASRMKPLYTSDLADRPDSPEMARLLAAGLRSAISYPLIVGGTVMGSVCCFNKCLDGFSPWQLAVVAAVADPLAIALDMTLRISGLQSRIRELEVLEKFEASLNYSFGLREALNVGLDGIMGVGVFDAGAIYLLEPDGRHLSLGAASRQDAVLVEAVSQIEGDGGALDAMVSAEHPTVFARQDCPDALAAMLSRERLEVIVNLPLRSKEIVFGMVLLGRRHGEQPTAQTLTFLESAASALARVVENARLFDKVARAKREWQETFDAMEDLVTLYDTNLRLIRANTALAARIGKPPPTLIGTDVEEIFGSADDLPLRLCAYRATMTILGPVTKELALPRLNGTFVITASPLRDHNGGVIGFVQVAKDVTELKRLEEEARAKQRLDDISRAKSAFIASISHELRAPLNSILGFSQLLRDGTVGDPPLTEKRARFVKKIIGGGEHLRNLINGILDLSKIEAGRIDLQLISQHVTDLIDSVSDLVSPIAEKKGIILAKEFAADLPPLFLDSMRLKQILFNLLSNAIKFTPDGGKVTVTVRRVQRAKCSQQGVADATSALHDMVKVTVTDTGIGVAQEDQARLFTPFSQLSKSAEGEGTGLGLAIAKQLVELHGGLLQMSSKGLGTGCTFTFTLPVLPLSRHSSS